MAQVKIQNLKVKVYDTILANTLDVVVTQDDGTKCSFDYKLLNLSDAPEQNNMPAINFLRGTTLGKSNYKIHGADYAAYVAANKSMQFTIDYIVDKLSLITID